MSVSVSQVRNIMLYNLYRTIIKMSVRNKAWTDINMINNISWPAWIV